MLNLLPVTSNNLMVDYGPSLLTTKTGRGDLESEKEEGAMLGRAAVKDACLDAVLDATSKLILKTDTTGAASTTCPKLDTSTNFLRAAKEETTTQRKKSVEERFPTLENPQRNRQRYRSEGHRKKCLVLRRRKNLVAGGELKM
ncbi:hypothetical protein TrLO_g50 [Triparma laevis f. longispina]|uniref:Uncharacterized protein n=1 Tax=Triparma laevis f. longispina TaxID=1714387 RepID=A0A9W7F4Y1_9STRA|nr:hypothetical protein TrLO_g50 [Triparma laevis f. longispina]